MKTDKQPADVQTEHGGFVADCGSHDAANENASLIAAAPDLLAVLLDFLEWFDSEGLSVSRARITGMAARAAIARAKGEKS